MTVKSKRPNVNVRARRIERNPHEDAALPRVPTAPSARHAPATLVFRGSRNKRPLFRITVIMTRIPSTFQP
jgi:hypothetical protein